MVATPLEGRKITLAPNSTIVTQQKGFDSVELGGIRELATAFTSANKKKREM